MYRGISKPKNGATREEFSKKENRKAIINLSIEEVDQLLYKLTELRKFLAKGDRENWTGGISPDEWAQIDRMLEPVGEGSARLHNLLASIFRVKGFCKPEDAAEFRQQLEDKHKNYDAEGTTRGMKIG